MQMQGGKTMDIFEIMKSRHSIRSYNSKQIEDEKIKILQQVITTANQESGLHIQLQLNDATVFTGFKAHYSKFNNVNNYIAIIGKKSDSLEETAGYYGEKVVLKATELGLGTCWVSVSYSKDKCQAVIGSDEKLVCVIALGYFDQNGAPHKTKPIEKLSEVSGPMPIWFKQGMIAAQLAPTAMNQQKFVFQLKDTSVIAKAGRGFYTKLDLGIVKYHFELGADKKNFSWHN